MGKISLRRQNDKHIVLPRGKLFFTYHNRFSDRKGVDDKIIAEVIFNLFAKPERLIGRITRIVRGGRLVGIRTLIGCTASIESKHTVRKIDG